MLVTKCKYLPFDAGKAAHLDRLCLENSSERVGPILVDCYRFVVDYFYREQVNTNVYYFVTNHCSKKSDIAMISMFLFFVDYFRQITYSKKKKKKKKKKKILFHAKNDSLEIIDVTYTHSSYIVTHQGLNCKLVKLASQRTAI